MKTKKIGFYHEGPSPKSKVSEQLAERHIRLMGRNATYGFEFEDFDLVVTDGSDAAEAIGKQYGKREVPVQTIDEFLDGEEPNETVEQDAPFNPDAPAVKKKVATQPKKK